MWSTAKRRRRSQLISAVLCAGMMALSPVAAQAGDDDADVLLRDRFDDGNIGTNTGKGAVGTGFYLNLCDSGGGCTTGAGGSVTEANGVATVSGGATVKAIVSNDAIDPRGTTLKWVVNAPRPAAGGADGVIVGWGASDFPGCCTNGIYLEVAQARIVFDLDVGVGNPTLSRYFTILFPSTARNNVYTNNTSKLTAKLKLDASGWRVRITGEGVNVNRKGTFGGAPGSNCTQPAGPSTVTCGTPTDVLNNTGGALHALAAVLREGASASFDSVLVTADEDDD